MNKRLYRSRKDKVFAGVAGGLGEYFEIDPVLVRILFVVVTRAGGWGVLAYIVCWIVIPQNPEGAPPAAAPVSTGVGAQPAAPIAEVESNARKSSVPGIILIVLGLFLLANNLLPSFSFGDYWPLLLIVLGGALIWKAKAVS
jgi:phage shock protein PspC (stress-responsive transcriptional regulator)